MQTILTWVFTMWCEMTSVTMRERMIKTKRIYEKLILDQEYMSWVDRQTIHQDQGEGETENVNLQFHFCA